MKVTPSFVWSNFYYPQISRPPTFELWIWCQKLGLYASIYGNNLKALTSTVQHTEPLTYCSRKFTNFGTVMCSGLEGSEIVHGQQWVHYQSSVQSIWLISNLHCWQTSHNTIKPWYGLGFLYKKIIFRWYHTCNVQDDLVSATLICCWSLKLTRFGTVIYLGLGTPGWYVNSSRYILRVFAQLTICPIDKFSTIR